MLGGLCYSFRQARISRGRQMYRRSAIFVLALGLGCASVAQANEQLRNLVDGPLRRAGVSDACIDSLDTTALTHIYSLTNKRPRGSSEYLKHRLQLRTFVGRYCPEL